MKTAWYIITAFMCVQLVWAQQSGTGSDGGNPGGTPIDVPDIIVRGSATLRLMTSSFLKQQPKATTPLSKRDLDSMNPKQKHEILALAPSAPPSSIPVPSGFQGRVEASVGMFQTPEISASYQTSVLGYACSADAVFMSTQGYQSGTDMHEIAAKVRGERMYANASGPLQAELHNWSLSTRSLGYSLFAQPDSASKRAVSSFAITSGMDHIISSMRIRSDLRLSSLTMDDTRSSRMRTSEQQLYAAANVEIPSDSTAHRFQVSVDLRPFASVLMSDNILSYEYSTSMGDSRLSGRLGLRGGTASTTAQRLDLTGAIELNAGLLSNLRFNVKLYRDNPNTFFSQVFAGNPYLSSSAVFDFTPVNIGTGISLHYAQSKEFVADVHGTYERFTRFAFPFLDTVSSAFVMNYISAVRLQLRAQVQWLISRESQVVFQSTIQDVRDSANERMPYQAAISVRGGYVCRVSDSWTAELGISYVSSRRRSLDRNSELPGYLYVDGRVDFAMTQSLSAFVRTTNLTNSSIFVFEEYRERGVFASLGIQWKF